MRRTRSSGGFSVQNRVQGQARRIAFHAWTSSWIARAEDLEEKEQEDQQQGDFRR